MSDLVLSTPDARETIDERRGFYRLAEQLAAKIQDTEFVPRIYRRRPMAILAAVLYGHELGLEPLTSINVIDVIEGRPSLSSEAQRGLVNAAGHAIDVVEHTTERCTVQGTRADNGVSLRVTWTLDDAQRAGLVGKDNWRRYPRAMLLARATSELCGAIFPDVVGGFASAVVDVVGVDPTDDVEVPRPDDPTRCALDAVEDEAELLDGPAGDDEPASDTVEDGEAATVEDAVLVDEATGEIDLDDAIARAERYGEPIPGAVEEWDEDDPERPF